MPESAGVDDDAPFGAVDASQLDARLRRLSPARQCPDGLVKVVTPGLRISNYERASTSSTPSTSLGLGFIVVPSSASASNRIRLTDFPNGVPCSVLPCAPSRRMLTVKQETLTHIMSHLDGDSQAAMSMVSKRFHALVTSPHAWQMAFIRSFPGHTAMAKPFGEAACAVQEQSLMDVVRAEARIFTRLMPLPSWRGEYLIRTRLLQSLARGRPNTSLGAIKVPGEFGGYSITHPTAVHTYRSGLPWTITNLHAVFPDRKKGLRAMHGSSNFCFGTISNPSRGRVEAWGSRDDFRFTQVHEIAPHLPLYGRGSGYAVLPNVMDVSQPYGMVGGEGFLGGRAAWRATGELHSHYLTPPRENWAMMGDRTIPRIPADDEAISSVWIAKSAAVPSATSTMVGIMTGSTLGVLTTYGLRDDSAGVALLSDGNITARWVLSPGVPIVALEVDDAYSLRRKSLGRVWAVALNALGEVFYLRETPTPVTRRNMPPNPLRAAWHAGRTARWELVERTRRAAWPDVLEKHEDAAEFPRSSSNAQHLSEVQLWAEAREINDSFAHTPTYFNDICDGWDMQRQLQVDFAGESIFVIDCGKGQHKSVKVTRYTQPLTAASAVTAWAATDFSLEGHQSANITASAIDRSRFALLCPFEEPKRTVDPDARSPRSRHPTTEMLGRRCRLLAVGTKSGVVVAWDMRDPSTSTVKPLRIIQTESPEVSCLAVSALYLLHGGSDGLAQAWDPLASTLEPVRTLNARASARIRNLRITDNHSQEAAARDPTIRAIHLDPNPTVLRGVLSFGSFVRYWSYSTSNDAPGRRRRGLPAENCIIMECQCPLCDEFYDQTEPDSVDLQFDEQQQSGDLCPLHAEFQLGFSDMTEQEAISYAQMISEETFAMDEQRRQSPSDATVMLSGAGSSASRTVTSDPCMAGESSHAGPSEPTMARRDDNTSEQLIQGALRLSLHDFPIRYKVRKNKNTRKRLTSPSS